MVLEVEMGQRPEWKDRNPQPHVQMLLGKLETAH
jgi:hypothetical protein